MTRNKDRSLDRRAFLVAGAGIGAAAALQGCRAREVASEPEELGAGGTAAHGITAQREEITAQREELFAHVTDQRASATPISAAERAARRARAGAVLAECGVDALLVEPGATMTWLTGVSWGKSERLFALVMLQGGSHLWVCPAFEESRARLSIDEPAAGGQAGPRGEIVAWNEHEHPYAPLASALREHRVERLAIEPQVRAGFVDRLAEVFGRERIVAGHQVVLRLRGRKDEHEIALLRRANELTKIAIREMAATLAPGLTGAQIGARMAAVHQKMGMRSPWCLALIGPAAALPHGDPDAAPLAKGDVLLIDTGASLHGYQSDISRTWTFGAPPSDEVSRVWHVVRDAQRAAYEAIAPGKPAKSIDARAREVVDARGFGPGYRTFTHRLGHGIGMEGHEDPYFDGGSEVVLEPGMTLSDEPGIYLPGKFDVRIEDIVLVTKQGADVFGAWQAGPESPA